MDERRERESGAAERDGARRAVREALAALLGLEPDIEVVAQVARADEVVDAARAHRPDVALLDIEMPGMTGLDAAAVLRTELPSVRIVILTTFGRPGHLRRAMESGAEAFLVKDAPRPSRRPPPATAPTRCASPATRGGSDQDQYLTRLSSRFGGEAQFSLALAARAWRRTASAAFGSIAATTSAYSSISCAPPTKSPRSTSSLARS